jgi:hypothetical protein
MKFLADENMDAAIVERLRQDGHLARLEDLTLGQQAQTALATSRMVGVETFTSELQRLAALEAKR